jgi:hypothetical protein
MNAISGKMLGKNLSPKRGRSDGATRPADPMDAARAAGPPDGHVVVCLFALIALGFVLLSPTLLFSSFWRFWWCCPALTSSIITGSKRRAKLV